MKPSLRDPGPGMTLLLMLPVSAVLWGVWYVSPMRGYRAPHSPPPASEFAGDPDKAEWHRANEAKE